jgi:hypothetical protein
MVSASSDPPSFKTTVLVSQPGDTIPRQDPRGEGVGPALMKFIPSVGRAENEPRHPS